MNSINVLQSLPLQYRGLPTPETSYGTFETGFRSTVEIVSGSTMTVEEREAAYVDHLKSKYGAHFRIESIPRDPDVLERLGKTMSGDDVIIAPNIVSRMAQDPETACYYERTIDHCFETVPQNKAYFASIGLTFEPCGVVVHEDGTVTYICGGGDTPERVAQVNAANAARDARRAQQRRIYIESSMQSAIERRRMFAELADAQTARLQALSRAGHTQLAVPAAAAGSITRPNELI